MNSRSGNRPLASGVPMRYEGAALTEFVVLCVAMVPLMFAVPMLGNLIDAKQASIQAGRYATWEATVHPSRQDSAVMLKDRFFTDEESQILSQPAELEANHLWGSDTRRESGMPTDTAIVIDEQSVSMTTRLHDDDSGLSISSTVGGVIETAGNAIGAVTDRDWGIGKTALTRTQVQVAVKSNTWIEALEAGEACGGGLGCFTAAGAILVDGWSARNDAQAKERTQAIVPATALEPVGEIVSILGAIPVFKELGGMEEMFGHVDMKPLPAHADRSLERYEEY